MATAPKTIKLSAIVLKKDLVALHKVLKAEKINLAQWVRASVTSYLENAKNKSVKRTSVKTIASAKPAKKTTRKMSKKA